MNDRPSYSDYYETIIAALLHDIGGFQQRGQGCSETHPMMGDRFVRDLLKTKIREPASVARIASKVANHHAHEPIVTLADQIAAGEQMNLQDEEMDQTEGRDVPLISILQHAYGYTPENKIGLDLKPLAFDRSIFPVPADRRSLAYQEQWEMFAREVQALPDDQAPECLVSHLDILLAKYCWCIPSAAGGSAPDISLYDHLRITAAVAACLSQYGRYCRQEADITTRSMLWVLGDIGGIQNYIYQLAEIGKGKAAARLRARSFRISHFLRQAAVRTIDRFDLPVCNLLLTSGGKFWLLLPARPDAAEILTSMQKDLEWELARDWKYQLSLRVAWTMVSGEDLANLKASYQDLNQAMRREKFRPHQTTLVNPDGTWRTDQFVPLDRFSAQLCPTCGLHPVSSETEECPHCWDEIDLGRSILRTSDSELFCSGRGVPYREVYSVPSAFPPHTVLTFVPLANYVPLDDQGYIVPFFAGEGQDENAAIPISRRSNGSPLLGFLKADVDNLGRFFSDGLPGRHQSGRMILADFMAASRCLHWFFAGYMSSLLEADFPDVYTVYSDGDDLLLIGPWDRLFDLAHILRQDFTEYAGGNPHLTLSAGLALVPAHYPVQLAVRQADDLLEHSKCHRGSQEEPVKNSLTSLGCTFEWKEYAVVLPKARELADALARSEISSSLVYFLLTCSRKWKAWVEHKNIEALRWLPLFNYALARRLPPEPAMSANQRRIFNWLVDLKETALHTSEWTYPLSEKVIQLRGLEFMAQYALYFNRNQGD